jgi:ribosomal protein S18 acetylase RimI-like enzyme
MAQFVIRPATTADTATIVDFNLRIAAETEDTSLDRDLVTRGVDALLTHAAHGRYYVACADQAVVGQIMHTREWSDWRNGDIWWVQSVYVRRDHRRRGVFRSLYDYVRNLAAADPAVVGVRLYVDADNRVAQATYERLGMDTARYRIMEDLFPPGRDRA